MQDSPSNERKVVKLCEYAAKNPFRIPKVLNFPICYTCIWMDSGSDESFLFPIDMLTVIKKYYCKTDEDN